MNGCSAMQARLSEYLDDRLSGREMQRIAAHLEGCRECASEWLALRQMQESLAALGPVPEPPNLLLRIRVAVSQERALRRQSPFHAWNMVWRNTVGPFLFQAAAGFASAVLLLGTVIVLVTMFAQPQRAYGSPDEPWATPRRRGCSITSTGAGNNQIGDLSGPVVVEAYVNGAGPGVRLSHRLRSHR